MADGASDVASVLGPPTAVDVPTAPPADPNAPPVDPYAPIVPTYGGTWPPPDWAIGVPPPVAVPADASSSSGLPMPPAPAQPPTLETAPQLLQPGLGVAMPASLDLPPPPPSAAEPALPSGALTRDRAPTDIAGPMDVGEALLDQNRGIATPGQEDKHQDAVNRWKSDPLNPDAAKDLTPEQRAQLLMAMPVEQRIAYQTQHYDEQQSKNRTDYLDLLHRQEVEAQNRLADFHKAQAATEAQRQQLLADATAQANNKTDSNPYWHSLSTGGKLLTALSVIIGGIGTNGKNVGLDIFNKATDDALRSQQQDREKQRDVLNLRGQTIQQQAAQQLEDYHADTAFRLAANQSMIQALQTEQQNYDPAGTTAQRISEHIGQYQVAQTELVQKYTQTQLKNNLDIAKDQREAATAASTIQHQRAEEGLAWAKESREKAAAKQSNVLHPPEYFAQLYGAENAPPAGVSMTDAQFHQYHETGGKIAEKQEKAEDRATKIAGTLIRNPITGIALPATSDGTANGKPITVPADVAKEINPKIGAAQNMIDALGRAKRLLDTDPSLIDRSTYAAITTDIETAKMDLIGMRGAKPSSREMDAVHDQFGPNFDGFLERVKDRSVAKAHIDALIDGTDKALATDLRTAVGYSGPSILKDTSNTPAPTKDVLDLLGSSLGSRNKYTQDPLANPEEAARAARNAVEGIPKADDDLDKLFSIANGESTDKLYKQYAADPAARAKALGYIQAAATEAATPELRERAGRLAASLAGNRKVGEDLDALEPDVATSNVEPAPPPKKPKK